MDFNLNDIVLKKITGVYNVNRTIKSSLPRNDRTICAFAFKLVGETVYTCNDKEYFSNPNTVLLIPKNIPYSSRLNGVGQCIMIEFECDKHIDNFYSFKINDKLGITPLLMELLLVDILKPDDFNLKALIITYQILHKIYLFKKRDYSIVRKEKLLQPIINYIQEKYYEKDITNDKLASIIGVSTIYFRKLFTTQFQKSPIKYLHEIRINHAKKLLLNDTNSVTTIADTLGFSSLYSFSRAFKQATGISPLEYARQHGKL